MAQIRKITISLVSGEIKYSEARQKADPGDTIEWNCADGNFAVQFQGLSPAKKRKDKKKKADPLSMVIRNANELAPGAYKYMVAVASGDDVFIDDPEIIIDAV